MTLPPSSTCNLKAKSRPQEVTMDFSERNFLERSYFHQTQTLLKWTRIFFTIVSLTGIGFVSFRLCESFHRVQEVNSMSRSFISFGPGPELNSTFKQAVESEGYHILLLTLFIMINSFGLTAIFLESFCLVLVYIGSNTSIFILSFTDTDTDNSIPNGIIFKYFLVSLTSISIMFFYLMRKRRVSFY